MSFWTKIFGGGVAPVVQAVNETAKTAADIVERWAPGDAKTHEMYMDVQAKMNEAVKQAQEANKPSHGSSTFSQVLGAISDFTNHMLAPVMIAFTMAAVFGYINVVTSTTDPILLTWAEASGAYVLGARAITRDIPALIKMLVELKRRK